MRTPSSLATCWAGGAAVLTSNCLTNLPKVAGEVSGSGSSELSRKGEVGDNGTKFVPIAENIIAPIKIKAFELF